MSNCKIIEVYYNKSNNSRARDTNRKVSTNSFLNGVLLYQKNRLICRYKFPLGEVSKLFKNKIKNVQQTLMMFGFIEIKDDFSVNMFKNVNFHGFRPLFVMMSWRRYIIVWNSYSFMLKRTQKMTLIQDRGLLMIKMIKIMKDVRGLNLMRTERMSRRLIQLMLFRLIEC